MQEKLKVNWHACTNCGSDLILAKNESECRGCSGFDLVHLILREVDAFHLVYRYDGFAQRNERVVREAIVADVKHLQRRELREYRR